MPASSRPGKPAAPRSGKPASSRADKRASARSGEPAPPARPRRLVITDAHAMRALAHPVRVALLEAMRRDGEITASRAAELLGESPGNMSWHLQTLAKYGFVEETGGGRGRSRPWRLTSDSRTFDTGAADPETVIVGEALERTFLERTYGQVREWWSRRLSYPVKWRRAAFMSDKVTYLTAPELTQVMDEISAILDRYADRHDKARRPSGALPVHLHAHGHPLPATPDGN